MAGNIVGFGRRQSWSRKTGNQCAMFQQSTVPKLSQRTRLLEQIYSLNQYLQEALFAGMVYDRARMPALQYSFQTSLSHSLLHNTCTSSAGEEESTNQGHPAESSPSQQLSQGAAILHYCTHCSCKRHDDITVLVLT